MKERSMKTPHGAFHWNELNTREPQTAREFYEKALGWTFEPMEIPDGTYYVAKSRDAVVGGIFEMKGPRFEGVPSHWLAYISVDDVDRRVETAVRLGATVMRPPWDIPGVGRIAILKDGTGAPIGFITPAN
jgi:predicted enzyme related to lactoylglutathione lyase